MILWTLTISNMAKSSLRSDNKNEIVLTSLIDKYSSWASKIVLNIWMYIFKHVQCSVFLLDYLSIKVVGNHGSPQPPISCNS